MVVPIRHEGDLERARPTTRRAELMGDDQRRDRPLKAAYRPDGVNVGHEPGPGRRRRDPGHLHVHVLPRWNGDTNFMTAVAEARVLPETLSATTLASGCRVGRGPTRR